MSPRSLLFSSNEETSRHLRQALEELELQVEHCPEIFSAVEKLTSQTFDVIAVDWDEGAEASFLLKTANELKSNQAAVTIAIVNDGASFPAAVFGVNVVLRKPVLSDEIKYSLLTCDEFLAHMRTWLAGSETTAANQTALPATKSNRRWPTEQASQVAAEPLAADPLPPFRISNSLLAEDNAYDDDESALFSQSGIQSLFHSTKKLGAFRKPHDISRLILISAACVAFLAAGYAFSQPTGHNPVALALVKTYDRTLRRANKWMHKPAQDEADDENAGDETADYNPANSPKNGRTTRIRIVPARSAAAQNPSGLVMQASSETQPEETQPEAAQNQSSLINVSKVPESLKTPPLQHRSDDPPANVSVSSRLAGVLQPVSLTQDLADQLLLEKVIPSYPLQALQARLQGPVVLEAWIGTDGAIRELKLVRGSLLLGKAACDAVKRWRYKPYLLNGQAVEAQTFVTVDFRLPSEMEPVQR